MRKTFSMAVLDSSCSWTVARKLRFDIFFNMLNDRDKCLVKTTMSNRTFYFGDGVEVKAINSVKFPVTTGVIKGVRAYIEANIVKNDLPLLLSHKYIKTAGMLLDLKNDSYWILGRYIKLQSMASRHYSLAFTNMLLEVEMLCYTAWP